MLRPAGRGALILGALLLANAGCSGPGTESAGQPHTGLRFAVPEGQSDNYFIQQDGISAHLNLQSRPRPRLVVAFPAGNSGAALFFDAADEGPAWGAVTGLQTIERQDDAGRTLYGIEAVIDMQAESLRLQKADVGSVRFLREAVDYSTLPPRAPPAMQTDGNRILFTRERPDGESSYLLEVTLLAGELQTGEGTRFVADAGGRLRIRFVAASGDPLEVPVPAARLLANGAGDNERLEDALTFLVYETKMLAGSWRFLTYFGRDTLLSTRLLMPQLTPEAAEIGIASVLVRINEQGEVAHEEEIGELAVMRNLAERNQPTAEPVYDYAMVDDNLMLAPVLRDYVDAFGVDRAQQFLSGRGRSSATLKSRLARNFELVVRQARAFVDDPDRTNLVAIKDGINVGNWRDSQEGLVGGRYPYDVNAVLLPAALAAIAEIAGSGLLDGHANSLPGRDELLRMARTWEANAAGYFRVSIDAEQAREKLDAYARDNGYPPVEAPASGLSFHAVALDAGFKPIPVMHSDVGADLLFLQRPEPELANIVANLLRPFPAGLSTPVGILAANPAYAGPEQQALVTRNHYHGTVAWSWQQAMIVAGLDRQLRRDDLSAALRQELGDARRKIRDDITANREIINSELWSFALRGDEYVIAPFGQSEGHLTESNAVQLWSTVFLAL